MAHATPFNCASRLRILMVPGIDNSGPSHWQTLWEQDDPRAQRVELGMWDRPSRNVWVNQLNHAIHASSQPTLLVAHSLGCHAVAWWAALERPIAGPVVGALLVAPPEVGAGTIDDRLSAFAPSPNVALPFPSILVASRNDPYLRFNDARALAEQWGCRFADVGRSGHINAESGIGAWDFGRFLLDQVTARAGYLPRPRVVNGPALVFELPFSIAEERV